MAPKSSKAGKVTGLDLISPDAKCLGQHAAQAVMDHLKNLSKEGSPEPLAEYKSLRKQHEKVGFALKLKLDPAACFCTLQEQTAASSSNTESSSTGWMSLWEIAAMKGLKFEEDGPNKLLMATVADKNDLMKRRSWQLLVRSSGSFSRNMLW